MHTHLARMEKLKTQVPGMAEPVGPNHTCAKDALKRVRCCFLMA